VLHAKTYRRLHDGCPLRFPFVSACLDGEPISSGPGKRVRVERALLKNGLLGVLGALVVKSELLRAAGLAVLIAGLPGCYYLNQAKGQADIVLNSRPIEDVYADPGLSEARARKLDLVLAARRFAEEDLGLKPSRNYTTYFDLGRGAVTYVVSACRPDAFVPHLWWFPIVGSLPYKGYFSEEDAEAEAAALRADGWDVTVGESAAYSTLGWFTDPVFSSMLSMSDASLASTVIHELVHGTIYVPDHSDFNESLATFVGRQGALQLLANRHGRDSARVAEARSRFEDEALFDAFIADLYERLDALYRSDRSREVKLAARELVFDGAREELKSLSGGRFRRLQGIPLNNAVIVAQYRYGRYNDFRRVFERVRNSWPAFFAAVSAAASSANPLGAVEALAREPW
jgi:predicted aminopeptidase